MSEKLQADGPSFKPEELPGLVSGARMSVAGEGLDTFTKDVQDAAEFFRRQGDVDSSPKN